MGSFNNQRNIHYCDVTTTYKNILKLFEVPSKCSKKPADEAEVLVTFMCRNHSRWTKYTLNTVGKVRRSRATSVKVKSLEQLKLLNRKSKYFTCKLGAHNKWLDKTVNRKERRYIFSEWEKTPGCRNSSVRNAPKSQWEIQIQELPKNT